MIFDNEHQWVISGRSDDSNRAYSIKNKKILQSCTDMFILLIYIKTVYPKMFSSWWRHPMETFSALLALCEGNSPVTGEFPWQRPVTWSFVFFDLRLNKRLSKQSWGWWFETPSRSLRGHCNVIGFNRDVIPAIVHVAYQCRSEWSSITRDTILGTGAMK